LDGVATEHRFVASDGPAALSARLSIVVGFADAQVLAHVIVPPQCWHAIP
jgi:hypothetical protein